MSASCINTSYSCFDSIYDRYVALLDKKNTPRTEALSAVMTKANTLIYLAKMADIDGDSDAVSDHCDEFDELLNNS